MEAYAFALGLWRFRFSFTPDFLISLVFLAGGAKLPASGLVPPVRFRVGARSAPEASVSESPARRRVGTRSSEAPRAAARLGASGSAECDGRG